MENKMRIKEKLLQKMSEQCGTQITEINLISWDMIEPYINELESIPIEPPVLKKIAVEYKDGWIVLLKQGDITISYPKSDVKQFIEDLSRALNGERLSTLH